MTVACIFSRGRRVTVGTAADDASDDKKQIAPGEVKLFSPTEQPLLFAEVTTTATLHCGIFSVHCLVVSY